MVADGVDSELDSGIMPRNLIGRDRASLITQYPARTQLSGTEPRRDRLVDAVFQSIGVRPRFLISLARGNLLASARGFHGLSALQATEIDRSGHRARLACRDEWRVRYHGRRNCAADLEPQFYRADSSAGSRAHDR